MDNRIKSFFSSLVSLSDHVDLDGANASITALNKKLEQAAAPVSPK